LECNDITVQTQNGKMLHAHEEATGKVQSNSDLNQFSKKSTKSKQIFIEPYKCKGNQLVYSRLVQQLTVSVELM